MKTILLIIPLLLLAGRIQAQSDGAGKGQAGAGPVNQARKANTGLTQGNGVPYSKDNKTKRRPGSNKPIPPSRVGAESDVTATAAGKISPGSHNTQRDRKEGINAMKPTSKSTGRQ
ncbi:hypothetical protein IC229_31000 [Spirosoma sp. BT702]|uniref:Uncharacterized protein n=1 Tax=Spirosoma profusum TaxID=2771354 RepID=A0A927AVB2_9BACT|nr:hypothetical protein [Spirosoma profusum]MBD2705095.1 hypothetical protein [Spirosoma profusum]